MTNQAEDETAPSCPLVYCLHENDFILPLFMTITLLFQDTLAQGNNLIVHYRNFPKDPLTLS